MTFLSLKSSWFPAFLPVSPDSFSPKKWISCKCWKINVESAWDWLIPSLTKNSKVMVGWSGTTPICSIEWTRMPLSCDRNGTDSSLCNPEEWVGSDWPSIEDKAGDSGVSLVPLISGVESTRMPSLCDGKETDPSLCNPEKGIRSHWLSIEVSAGDSGVSPELGVRGVESEVTLPSSSGHFEEKTGLLYLPSFRRIGSVIGSLINYIWIPFMSFDSNESKVIFLLLSHLVLLGLMGSLWLGPPLSSSICAECTALNFFQSAGSTDATLLYDHNYSHNYQSSCQ